MLTRFTQKNMIFMESLYYLKYRLNKIVLQIKIQVKNTFPFHDYIKFKNVNASKHNTSFVINKTFIDNLYYL